MSERTLRCFACIAMFALSACRSETTAAVTSDAAPIDPAGWWMASGQAPTKAEFAALAATCRQQAKGSFDSCLANLGLKRTP